jgi:hypothetical protein
MKKEILQTIKVIVLGLVLTLGISFTFATWNPAPPEGFTTTNNVDGPINSGSVSQDKLGSLSLGGNFVVGGASRFFGNVILEPSTSNNDDPNTTLTLSSLSTGEGGESRPLCVNGAGTVILCDASSSGGCGTANGGLFTSVPTTGLCATNSTLTGGVNGNGGPQTPSWNWTCTSNAGNGPVTCNANMKVDANFSIVNVSDDEVVVKTLTSTTVGGYGAKTYEWTATWNGQGNATFSNPTSATTNVTLDKKQPGGVDTIYVITLTVHDSANPQHTGIKTKNIVVPAAAHP